MKFSVLVREKGTSRTWREHYDYPNLETADAVDLWAGNMIANFNNTLKEGEKAREVLEINLIGASELPLQHDWEKDNLVTIIEEGMRPYDLYRCTRCGAWGKRFGLDAIVTPDPDSPRYCGKEEA